MTGRPRGSTLNRRPSIAVAAVTSGRDQDTQSAANFSMAGPAPVNTIEANQAYVDPGYSQLNPAYDQPVNTRPVWGLAKPLPRVIRPGMVPTRSEINLAPPQPQQVQDLANVDLEQGRIQPTLNVNKISSQLQNTREERENNILRTFSRTGGPPVSNLGRAPSSVAAPLSPPSEAIEEEDEDLGLQPLEPKEDQAGSARQGEQTTPTQHWYPDDAASAVTEHEQEGDLDGDYIHGDIPLPAYDAEADEIHNLHTHWSVIRLRFREPLAELLAVRFHPQPTSVYKD
jgi:aquaglyceroporin related protein